MIIEVSNETDDRKSVRVVLEDAANGTEIYNRTVSVGPDDARRLSGLERWYEQDIVLSAEAGGGPRGDMAYSAGSLCGTCFVTVHIQPDGITFSLGVAD